MMRNDVRTKRRLAGAVGLVLVQFGLAACDRMALTAPTNSTVSVTTADLVLPTGGRTEVTAFVAESSGNPVQNGTVVRFSTTLGRLAPEEVQTRNGFALTTFLAGDISGIAAVRAISGSTGGTTSGAGDTASTTNEVRIAVGAAAVETVTVRANPGSVPARGGTSQIVATVLGATGRAVPGITVNFTTSRGTLSVTSGVSDMAGEVRTVLTVVLTAADEDGAIVRATAGAAPAAEVAIMRQAPLAIPAVALEGEGDDPTKTGQRFVFTATVSGHDDTTRPVRFEWDFGDGTTAVTSGGRVVLSSFIGQAVHFYDDELVRRIVTVRVTLENGDTISDTTEIFVEQFLP